MAKVVVFSGGFDSTYLIKMLINDINDNADIPRKINLISFNNDMCGVEKSKRESAARKKIVEYFKKHYKSFDFKYNELVLTGGRHIFSSENNSGLSQPIIWASMLVPILERDSEVYFGYIKNDDLVVKLDSMRKLLEAMSELQNFIYSNKVKFYFPLILHPKHEVIFRLYQEDPELIKYCTLCESPGKEDNCGKCHTCNNFINSLINGAIEFKDSTKIFEEILLDRFNIKFSYKQLRRKVKPNNDKS